MDVAGIYSGIFYGGLRDSKALGVSPMSEKEVRIFLTKHVQTRFRERLGVVSRRTIIGWIKSSLRQNIIRQVIRNRYRLKLRGTPYQIVLSREGQNTWVAVTIIPPPCRERRRMKDEDNPASDAQAVCSSEGKRTR